MIRATSFITVLHWKQGSCPSAGDQAGSGTRVQCSTVITDKGCTPVTLYSRCTSECRVRHGNTPTTLHRRHLRVEGQTRKYTRHSAQPPPCTAATSERRVRHGNTPVTLHRRHLRAEGQTWKRRPCRSTCKTCRDHQR